MKHKDSDLTGQVNSEPEKNNFYEEEYLQRNKKKRQNSVPGCSKFLKQSLSHGLGYFFCFL